MVQQSLGIQITPSDTTMSTQHFEGHDAGHIILALLYLCFSCFHYFSILGCQSVASVPEVMPLALINKLPPPPRPPVMLPEMVQSVAVVKTGTQWMSQE